MMKFFDNIISKSRHGNMVPRVISILLAVVLWAYVSESKVGELNFKIPVTYKNLPANMTVSFISHKNVIASLQGKNEYLKNVQLKNIQAVVDLKNPRIGSLKKYKIQLQKTEIPEDITVELDTRTVDAIVELLVFKKLKVVPRITGEIDKEYFVGSIKIDPEYILAEGPQSVVDSLNYINTEDIDISGLKEDVIRDVELKKDNFTGLNLSETNVNVVVPITMYGSLHRLDVPVVARNADQNFTFKFVEPVIKIYYKSVGTDRFTPGDIDVFVDVTSLKLNILMKNRDKMELDMPVKINVKPGMEGKGKLEIVSVIPETVKLYIVRRP